MNHTEISSQTKKRVESVLKKFNAQDKLYLLSKLLNEEGRINIITLPMGSTLDYLNSNMSVIETDTGPEYSLPARFEVNHDFTIFRAGNELTNAGELCLTEYEIIP